MKNRKKDWEKGNTLLEYAILLPVIFACVVLCIYIFIIFYQKTLIQNIAEDTAQSISRQWGYKPLPTEEMTTGVYKKETYESREVYWHLKLLGNKKKESTAIVHIKDNTKNIGLLKPYINDKGQVSEPEVIVDFKAGFPSVLHVNIRTMYNTPAKGLLKLIGFKEYLVIEGKAQALVYDPKDMINTTDYAYQIIRETKIYKKFIEKIKPLKANLDKFLKE